MAKKSADSSLADLQRALEDFAKPSQDKPRADEVAVAAIMSAARDELRDEPQNAEEMAAQEAATKMALLILAEKPRRRSGSP